MKNRKLSLLLLALFICAPQTTHGAERLVNLIFRTENKPTEEVLISLLPSSKLKTALIVGGVAATLYGLGRISGYITAKVASFTYDFELKLIAGKDNVDIATWKTVKENIYRNHEQNNSYSAKYRNYPLMSYKTTLDSFIASLAGSSLVCYGTSTGELACSLYHSLEKINKALLADKDFFTERRTFEQETAKNRS